MIRTALLAALALVCVTLPADARQKHRTAACAETGTLMQPVCGTAQAAPGGFLTGIRSIKVTMHRERVRKAVQRVSKTAASRAAGYSIAAPPPRYGTPTTSWMETTVYSQARAHVAAIGKPARYIAGRLICAVNVGAALAERGIKGTGSALALSYLKWGQESGPVPGAVAVSARRGGGHVAIVSRVEGGQVYVWNPSPRGRGWQEMAYRHRAISFRVPG